MLLDLRLSDVEFVFKTESKSIESQTLFNDIKNCKSIIALSRLVQKNLNIFEIAHFGNYIMN